jgi:hypothetical protein
MNQTRAVPQPTVSPQTRDLDGNAVCVVHEVSLGEGSTLVFLFSTVSINPTMVHTLSSSKRLLRARKNGRRMGTSQQIHVGIARFNLVSRQIRVISFTLQPIYPGKTPPVPTEPLDILQGEVEVS